LYNNVAVFYGQNVLLERKEICKNGVEKAREREKLER
jgi:hypothetical protein